MSAASYTRTLPENLQVIKETGIYGPDIRTAIAEAMDQVRIHSDEKIERIQEEVESDNVYMSTSVIEGSVDEYRLTIANPS